MGRLRSGDQAIVIGMGPGFVLDGVCLRMVSEDDVSAIRATYIRGAMTISPWTAAVAAGVTLAAIVCTRGICSR